MADVPESSSNPHAPEYIPIPTSQLPPPPRRRTYVLLPLHRFLPVRLTTHPYPPLALPPGRFLPVMLPMHPYSPLALPPHRFLPVMLPPYPYPPLALPPHRFLPVMLPTHPYPPLALPPRQFLPVMLPTHLYPPMALPPRQFPPALPPHYSPPNDDSPPQEDVRQRRRTIPSRPRRITTVLIWNIPYDYNRESLMEFLDEYCFLENLKDGENIHIFAYDFLYLPRGFRNNRNKGYAFVNFTDQRTLRKFFGDFSDGVKAYPRSTKIVEIDTANIQGKNNLVNRYKNKRFVCESERWLPVWFDPPRNGSGESVQMITVGDIRSHSR